VLVPTEAREISVGTVEDLNNCARGVTSERGDICTVLAGTYDLSTLAGGSVRVLLEGVTIRSVAGPFVTIVRGSGLAPLISIEADNVVVNGFLLSNSGQAPLIQVNDPTRRNVRIAGNLMTNLIGPFQDGVRFSATSLENVFLINNTIWRGTGHGVWFDSAMHDLSGVEITDMRVLEMGQSGIRVQVSGDVSDFLVWSGLRCEFQRMGATGIDFSSVDTLDNIAIFGCTIRDNQGSGVSLHAVNDIREVILLENQIEDNGQAGVGFAAPKMSTIRFLNNRIRGNQEGILLSAVKTIRQLMLISQELSLNRASGLSVYCGEELQQVQLSDNLFLRNREHGAFLRAQRLEGFSSTDDRFEANGVHGLYFDLGRTVHGLKVERAEVIDHTFDEGILGTGILLFAPEGGTQLLIRASGFRGNQRALYLESPLEFLSGVEMLELEIESIQMGIGLVALELLQKVTLKAIKISNSTTGALLKAREGSALLLQDVQLEHNQVGLELATTGTIVESVDFRNNAQGIVAQRTDNIRVKDSNFEGNREFGVRVAEGLSGTLDARDNWWGAPTGPRHANNPQGRGDAVSDRVQFDPFLTQPR